MAILIEEGEASEAVLAVYADIKATRKTDWVNNFWKALVDRFLGSAHMRGIPSKQYGVYTLVQ